MQTIALGQADTQSSAAFQFIAGAAGRSCTQLHMVMHICGEDMVLGQTVQSY
jgi:hypothetical protein